MIDVKQVPEHLKQTCVRLNALGSLFYFAKAILNYPDLNHTLHWQMCSSIEKEELSEVKEYPRGHLKTTIFSIAAPMWWALPFTDEDEGLMRGLGYGDAWIRWMHRAHDQDTSTLLLSETDENAEKMGKEIGLQYAENKLFGHIFPSILPDRNCTWNMSCMTHKRLGKFSREGTYELAGVGKALQSRHYPRIIEDDLFGEKALFSPTEAEFTIEFHRKLPGLYRADAARPHHIGDNLVVGNRWSVNDLNGWIRKNQPSYDIETHAVDGGCCKLHPKGEFIFPEFYTVEKLGLLRASLGPTALAAQYYNNPLDDSVRRFQDSWIRHYRLDNVPHPHGLKNDKGEVKLITSIHHEAINGEVEKDLFISQLERFIVVDVLHNESEKSRGRARHAVLTLGYLGGKKPRLYLLNTWAKRSSYEEMTNIIFSRARSWRCSTVWVETLAGQDGWLYYFRERNMNAMASGLKSPLKIEGLKKDRSADAKHRRISSLEPLFFSGMVWASKSDNGYGDFRSEYDSYPSDSTIDILDTLGYAPQCINPSSVSREELSEFMRKRENFITSGMGNAGY
jgi:hypothetical protein